MRRVAWIVLLVMSVYYLILPILNLYAYYGSKNANGQVWDLFLTQSGEMIKFIINAAFIVGMMVIAGIIIQRLLAGRTANRIRIIPREVGNNSDESSTRRILPIPKILSRTKEIPRPSVRFEDIAGIDEVREELIELVDFLKTPEKYTRLGGKIPRGALLVGRSGTGKTMLAKAVAGEADKPFFYYAGSDFNEMYVGVGAARARSLFDNARKYAPCIVFIDEMDAIGKRTDSGSGGEQEYNNTINQFLADMDGFDDNTGIIFIGATNNINGIDSAFLRPGRFDRIIHVNLPDIKGREEILAVHTKSPVILSPEVNKKDIARMTAGFSGAQLANLVNEAAIDAAKHDRDAIYTEHFERAKEKVTMGKENLSLASVLTEEEKTVIAYHEAGHALVAISLPGNDPLYKVSIIPRGQALGITSQLPEKDRYNYSSDFLEEMLAILFAGRIAEEKHFKKITTGAENDIERGTEIATAMVTKYGMSRLGMLNLDNNRRILSEETKREIDMEIRRIIEKSYEQTKEIIEDNWEKLEKIARALLERETLTREEVEELVKEP